MQEYIHRLTKSLFSPLVFKVKHAEIFTCFFQMPDLTIFYKLYFSLAEEGQ